MAAFAHYIGIDYLGSKTELSLNLGDGRVRRQRLELAV
jgi:hypothetical protein